MTGSTDSVMRASFVFVLGCLLVLVFTLCYAIIYGDLMFETALISSLPWGLTTFVDIYIGFLLFSLWIISREPGLATGLVWSGLVMVLGNLVCCIYVLYSIHRSGYNRYRFWNQL